MGQLTSTKVIFDQTSSFINKSQSNLFDLQRQISSGKKFDSFDKMSVASANLKALKMQSAGLTLISLRLIG